MSAPPSVRPSPFEYQAFISYSRRDRESGIKFQKAVERYKIPAVFRGQSGPVGVISKRITPIFRDEWDGEAAGDLEAFFEQALADSAWLIVLCSPNAAQSKWVNLEIETFQKQGKGDRIIPVIVHGLAKPWNANGEKDGAFPPALFTTTDDKIPLAPDIRDPEKTGFGDGFDMAVTKTVAKLIDVAPFELTQRQLQAERRERRVIVSGLIGALILAAIAITGGIVAYEQRQIALANESISYAQLTRELSSNGKYGKALGAIKTVLPEKQSGLWARPITEEAIRALAEVLGHLNSVEVGPHEDSLLDIGFVNDGREVIAISEAGEAFQWAPATTNPAYIIGTIPMMDRHRNNLNSLEIGPSGRHALIGYDSGSTLLWDARTQKKIKWFLSEYMAIHPTLNVCAVIETNGVNFYDLRTGERSSEPATIPVEHMSLDDIEFPPRFSSDGAFVAYATGARIFVNTLGDGKRVLDIRPEGNVDDYFISEIAVHASGKVIVALDDYAACWDIAKGREIWRFDNPQCPQSAGGCPYSSLSFHPKKAWVALSSVGDRDAYVVDLNTGAQRMLLEGHQDNLDAVIYSPTGDYLMTIGYDRFVRIWDSATGENVFKGPVKNGAPSARWRPDSQAIVTNADNEFGYIRPLLFNDSLSKLLTMAQREEPPSESDSE